MSITEQMRGQAGAKFIYTLLLLLSIDWIIGWAVSPAIIVAGLVAGVTITGLLAVTWITSVEWTRIGIGEEYGEQRHAEMHAAMEADLRERLDPIGKEAYDELQKAIARLQEQDEADA